jgi:hypothetical protein
MFFRADSGKCDSTSPGTAQGNRGEKYVAPLLPSAVTVFRARRRPPSYAQTRDSLSIKTNHPVCFRHPFSLVRPMLSQLSVLLSCAANECVRSSESSETPIRHTPLPEVYVPRVVMSMGRNGGGATAEDVGVRLCFVEGEWQPMSTDAAMMAIGIKFRCVISLLWVSCSSGLTLYSATLRIANCRHIGTHLINRGWMRQRPARRVADLWPEPLLRRSKIHGYWLPKPCKRDSQYNGALSRKAVSLLAPCPSPKSLTTHPFPIYEMGSSVG